MTVGKPQDERRRRREHLAKYWAVRANPMSRPVGNQINPPAFLGVGAVSFLAFASAGAIANGYYIQPILVDVGKQLSIAEGLVGFLPAVSQLGLAMGVAFLLPLGDVVSTRALLLFAIPAQIAALLLLSLSHSGYTALGACLFIGMFGITPYLLPPYASQRVRPDQVGQVTGALTSGVIAGILLARTASGTVAMYLGWRSVYAAAAVIMAAILVCLLRVVKAREPGLPQAKVGYRSLLATMYRLPRDHAELRAATMCQALSFGSFNVFWLGLTLYLRSPAFGWTTQSIGLVAIVGVIASSGAPMIGRLAHRFGPGRARTMAFLAFVFAWVLMAVCQGNLVGMAAALVLLDIASAMIDISNRTILYGLDATIRTRLNAVYTVGMFAGGALLSSLVGLCWTAGGWRALCVLGITSTSAGLLVSWRSRRASYSAN